MARRVFSGFRFMIPIRNIYYMLSYAFRELRSAGYEEIGGEDFDHVYDLSAAILVKGIGYLIRQGLGREYQLTVEEMRGIKGKVVFSESVKMLSFPMGNAVCSYDDFSRDSVFNRILKTTANFLIKCHDVDASRQRSLRDLMCYFEGVNDIDLSSLRWDFQFHRNNQIYELLIHLCYLVFCKHIASGSESDRLRRFRTFDDDTMHALYERFILEYFRKEHPDSGAKPAGIRWNLLSESARFLPAMQCDVMLGDTTNRKGARLIIDAKYYEKPLQRYYGVDKVISGHLYQIFSYVKNEDREGKGNVSGLLLYAQSQSSGAFCEVYDLGGSRIGVMSLDLGCDFEGIRSQLDGIPGMFGLQM